MRRAISAFGCLFAAYALATVSFISLSLYPAFIAGKLDFLQQSASNISLFPLALVFFVRSVMACASEKYRRKTRLKFFLALLVSTAVSALGFYSNLSENATIAVAGVWLATILGVFLVPKKRHKPVTKRKAQGAQGDMSKKTNNSNSSAQKQTPFVINSKTGQRVLPELNNVRHIHSPSDQSASSGQSRLVTPSQLRTSEASENNSNKLDELKTRIESIKEFEQMKRHEAILRNKNTSSRDCILPKASALSDFAEATGNLKAPKSFYDANGEDEIINDADNDDEAFAEENGAYEISTDDESEIIYDDESDAYNDDVPTYASYSKIVRKPVRQNAMADAESPEDDASKGVGGLARKNDGPRKWLWTPPSEDVFVRHKSAQPPLSDKDLKEYENRLIKAMESYQISGKGDGYVSGPTVTLFKVELAAGVKVSKIISVSDDIARFLGISSAGLRILPTIEGTHDIGIEMPNSSRQTVSFADTIRSLKASDAALPFALGKSITGKDTIIDIAKTPHLLIAGSTGSGKSVALNVMIASLLLMKSPEDVRFLIVDPKQVELELYNGLPHLLSPVITDMKMAIKALDFCIREMERRYAILSKEHVRNIIGYNEKIIQDHLKREKMPYIVVIIDEFADVIDQTGKDFEQRIMRLAAKARAIGIHLVLATQRPSVDVVTGTLKNNIPTRIAFRVPSAVDSKTILDHAGAEKLLGNGDMLLKSQTEHELIRIQGSFLSDGEVESLIRHSRMQDEPDYIDDEWLRIADEKDSGDGQDDVDYAQAARLKWNDKDERLLQAAWDIAMEQGGISTSYIQRALRIGYNLAATIVDEMAERGIIGPQQGSKKRPLIKFKE